ncbi:ankyrin repeat domain-containing protein [bacterium]|nr:ankyrin repeat domain-containing protein [bacterium]
MTNIDKQDSLGRSALHRAALQGNFDEAEQLIKKGADVNNKSTVGTPLYYAVDEGHVELVKLLIDNGANVNESNGIGYLPLDTAIENLSIAFSQEDKDNFSIIIDYLKTKNAKRNK